MRIRLLIGLLPLLLTAQVAQKANEGYKTEKARANVGASLADPERDARQKPKELIASIGIKPGMAVADLGTGVGYMLPFLSAAVGPSGRVVAEDIFPDFLNKAKQRGADAKLANVTYILGNEKSPELPAGELDVVLVLDVYHHFDYPGEMLAVIKRSLKPGGRLALVEYYKRKESMPNGRALEHIRLDDSGMIAEIESHGFKLLSEKVHIAGTQYLALFEVK